MLLTGTHLRTLDDKKRVGLPKKLREQLEEPESLWLAPGPDKCQWVYNRAGLESLSAKLDETPATDAEGRVFRRLFYAQIETVDVDRAGRVLVPDRLAQFAGLQREVVLIGVRDHLELWDAKRWQAYSAEHSTRFDAVAENAFRK